MTTRINSLTVVLEETVREDDAQASIAAILQIKGVLSVAADVADAGAHAAKQQARTELIRELCGVLWPPLGEKP